MTMLQYVGRERYCKYPLKKGMLTRYVYNQLVNRVIDHELDPFIVKHTLPSIQDLKDAPWSNLSLWDICVSEASKIEAMGLPVYVLWSGGIDSTLALVAVLNAFSSASLERVHIACTSDSVKEAPQLWHQTIVPKFKGRIHSSHTHAEEYCKKGLLVTGIFGDLIFGSDLGLGVRDMFGESAMLEKWEKIVPLYFERELKDQNFPFKYTPTLSASMYDIVTVFDWCWWFNFTNAANHLKYSMLGMQGWSDPKTWHSRVINFFEPIPFQQWSMSNPQDKLYAGINSYKGLAKNLIVKYSGATEFETKRKVPSMQRLFHHKNANYAIDTNYKFMNDEEIMECINR